MNLIVIIFINQCCVDLNDNSFSLKENKNSKLNTRCSSVFGLAFPSSKPMKSFDKPFDGELIYAYPNVSSSFSTDSRGINRLN